MRGILVRVVTEKVVAPTWLHGGQNHLTTGKRGGATWGREEGERGHEMGGGREGYLHPPKTLIFPLLQPPENPNTLP